ncbi:MAG: GNAT family N-acetyltransferase [Sphingomonadaceae bacterium]|nr:GNAT family N-acetyltransferase [Sphingomonadaceae bacterium]
MTAAAPLPLRFQVGARTLFAIRRRLVRVGLSLDGALDRRTPALPPLGHGDHGYLITSLAARHEAAIRSARPHLLAVERQRYMRRYAHLSGGFDAYLGALSSNTRSTLKRKTRKFRESFGELDFRTYRSPAEIATFHDLAISLSRMTYQERLLDAGLPEGEAARAQMVHLTTHDRVRAFLLFAEGAPIAYLYCPAEGDTLIYAHLGYDPAFAAHSPGAVLQFEAMRALVEEGRFARFDFTEGDGQHKRQFATGAVECVDLLLLRRTPANLLLAGGMRGFDVSVSVVKRVLAATGGGRLVSRIRR